MATFDTVLTDPATGLPVAVDGAGNPIHLVFYPSRTGGTPITVLQALDGTPLPGYVTPTQTGTDTGRVQFAEPSGEWLLLYADRGYGDRWPVLSGGVADAINALRDDVGALEEEFANLPTMATGATVNVADHGAVGDASSDASAGVQAALKAGVFGAVTVVFPPGTYRVTAELNVYGNTTLLMHNATLRREHSGYLILVGDRGASYAGYTGNTNLHVRGGVLDCNGQNYPSTASTWCMSHVNNVSFEGVIFRNGANSHFIECNAARHVRVTRCGFEGHNDTGGTNYVEAIQLDLAEAGGFSAYGSYDGTACEDIEVDHCWFAASDALPANPRGVGSHGGRVDGQHRNIRVHHNWFLGLRSYAVSPMNWENFDIHHNQINGAGGIWVRTLPIGNPLDSNTMTVAGVQTGASANITGGRISDNNIRATAAMVGIYLDGEDTGKIVDVAVDDNRVYSEGSVGISLHNTTNCAARINTIRKGGYATGFRNDTKCAGTIHYGNDAREFGASGYVDIGTGSITSPDGAAVSSGALDITKIRPEFLTRLIPATDGSVIQGAWHDDVSGDWYVTQVVGGTDVDNTCWLSRCAADGTLLDYMKLIDAGHGTALWPQRVGDDVYIWLNWSESATQPGVVTHDLVKFLYRGTTDGQTLNRSETSYFTVMPKFGGDYVTVAADPFSDWIAYREANGTASTVKRRKISEVLAGVDATYGATITFNDGFQGMASIDDTFYYTNGSGTGTDNKIYAYSWNTGELVAALDNNRMGLQPDGTAYGDYLEPEGLCVARDSGNTPHLVAGLSMGPSGTRRSELFVFSPPGSADLIDVQVRSILNALPYDLRMQAKRPVDGTTSFQQITQPGWYYFSTTEWNAIVATDKPAGLSAAGFFLEVSGIGPGSPVIQRLSRAGSAANLPRTFMRVLNPSLGAAAPWFEITLTAVASG